MITSLLETLGHVYPFRVGLYRIASRKWVKARYRAQADESVATLRNGIRVRVRLRDVNGRMLRIFGTIDPKVVDVCRRLVRTGDAFLDLGANYGSVGLLCAHDVGPSGRLVFVEPQADLAGRIRDAIAGAGLGFASVRQVALTDRDGMGTLILRKNHSGAASISSEGGDGDSEEVELVSVGSILKDVPGDARIAAKVDIEGQEPVVLPPLLADGRVRFVLFECRDRATAEAAFDSGGGAYRFYGLKKALFRAGLVELQSVDAFGGYHDVLALRREDIRGSMV